MQKCFHRAGKAQHARRRLMGTALWLLPILRPLLPITNPSLLSTRTSHPRVGKAQRARRWLMGMALWPLPILRLPGQPSCFLLTMVYYCY